MPLEEWGSRLHWSKVNCQRVRIGYIVIVWEVAVLYFSWLHFKPNA